MVINLHKQVSGFFHMSAKILNISALQILDSRGTPTLQASVLLQDGSEGTFQVPSGASTGTYEAYEKRDGRPEYFFGKSVEQCLTHVKDISDFVIGKEFTQDSFDALLKELDGTENKSNLGANTILALSAAFSKALAQYYGLPLYEYFARLVTDTPMHFKKKIRPKDPPYLFANVINGGKHCDNSLQIQEFMLVPLQEST